MDYNIKTNDFEGPMDLLLFLINKSKIQIVDISIADITEQYVQYLDKMLKFNAVIASEFLVMASHLLYIKSRALLPKIKEEEESDPEEELILRLEEYKRFKEVSLILKEKESLHANLYYRLPEEYIVERDESLFLDDELGDSYELLSMFIKLIEKDRDVLIDPKPYKMSEKRVSIGDKVKEIKDLLLSHNEINFSQLIANNYQRENIVATFLAILEMLKDHRIILFQDLNFDDIKIRRK